MSKRSVLRLRPILLSFTRSSSEIHNDQFAETYSNHEFYTATVVYGMCGKSVCKLMARMQNERALTVLRVIRKFSVVYLACGLFNRLPTDDSLEPDRKRAHGKFVVCMYDLYVGLIVQTWPKHS